MPYAQRAIPYNSLCELMPYQALRSWINKKSTTEDTRWGVMIYSQKGLMISTTDDTRWGVMIYSQIRLMISTTLRAVMICQTCGLDKKSRIKMIRLFWCTSEENVRIRLVLKQAIIDLNNLKNQQIYDIIIS